MRLWCAVYLAVMLLGGALFGNTFYARADPFEVYSSLVARLSVWGRRDGVLVVRSPLANLDTVPVRPGLVAVVAVLFGSTAFDSFKDSIALGDVRPGRRRCRRPAQQPGAAGASASAVGPGLRASAACSPGSATTCAAATLPNLFAHSVVPIIVGYIVAHYLTYLVEAGQDTLIKASDPLGNGSNLLGTGDWSINYWLSYHPTLLATHQGARRRARARRGRHRRPRPGDQGAAAAPPAHRPAAAAGGDGRLHRGRALPAVRRLSRTRAGR